MAELPGFRLRALTNAQGQVTYQGPREGNDLLDWVGPAKGIIESGQAKLAERPPHNPVIQWKIRGDAADGGYTLNQSKPYSGQERGTNTPLERHTADIILITLFDSNIDAFNAWIDAQVKAGIEELPPDWIIEQCTGKTIYYDVGVMANEKTGAPISVVENFIKKSDYEKQVTTTGQGRRPRPDPKKPEIQGPVGPQGPQSPIGLPNPGGPRPVPSALGPPAAPRVQAPSMPGTPPMAAVPGTIPGVSVPGGAPANGPIVPNTPLGMPLIPPAPVRPA